VALDARADSAASDELAIAVYIEGLVLEVYYDAHGASGRFVRLPNVLVRFERSPGCLLNALFDGLSGGGNRKPQRGRSKEGGIKKVFHYYKLVVFKEKEYPEHHRWIGKILGAFPKKESIIQECDDVLSVIAEVETDHGVAVVGEFIKAVIGERVRFVPFESKEHSLELGLLH